MFSAFSQTQNLVDTWNKLGAQQLSHVEAACEQVGKLQSQAVERSGEMVDEAARLTKETAGQLEQMSTTWRKQWLEAVKQTAGATSASL